MPKPTPVSRREFIQRLHRPGFEGPFTGGNAAGKPDADHSKRTRGRHWAGILKPTAQTGRHLA